MTGLKPAPRSVEKRAALHAAIALLLTAPAASAQQSPPTANNGVPIEQFLGHQTAQNQTAPAEAPETSLSVGGVPVEDLIDVEAAREPEAAPAQQPAPGQGVPVEQLIEVETPSAATSVPQDGGSDGNAPLTISPPPQPAAVDVAPATAAEAPQSAAQNTNGAPAGTAETPPPAGNFDPLAAADPNAPPPPPGVTSLKLAKADRVYDLAFPRGQIQWMMRSVAPSLVEALKYESARIGAPAPPDLDARVQAIVADEMAGLEEEMRPAIVPIYAVELTEPELDELLKLYSSEEGRSMMAKMQVLSGAVANEMRVVIERFNNRVGDRIEAELLAKPE